MNFLKTSIIKASERMELNLKRCALKFACTLLSNNLKKFNTTFFLIQTSLGQNHFKSDKKQYISHQPNKRQR